MAKHLPRQPRIKKKKKKDKSQAQTNPPAKMPQVRPSSPQHAPPRSDIYRRNVMYQLETNLVTND